MMDITEKQITVAGQTYVFKLPSSQDKINIDLKALELRQGVTAGMGDGYAASQNIAYLTVLCKAPEKVNFSTTSDYVVEYLATEVAKWEKSFRDELAGATGSTSP